MKRKAKPFGFDTFFDEEIIKRLREEEEARRLEEEEAAANRPPTFTEEEIETARREVMIKAARKAWPMPWPASSSRLP